MDPTAQARARIADEFNATLTPDQRQLLLQGRLTVDKLTPQQVKIAEKMSALLGGISGEQARQLAGQDLVVEGYEAGRRYAQEHYSSHFGFIFWVIALLIIGLFVLNALIK